MRIAVHIARSKDEAASELKRILPQLMLPESPALRALPRLRVVPAQQMKQISGLQSSRVISLPFFVDQQRKCDAGLFTKQRGVTSISQPDRCQLSAFALELGFVLAQLRYMLAAEDSAVVAEENDHSQVRLP